MSRRICVVPSSEMLRGYSVEHWLQRFEEFSQRSANEMVLPAIGFSGPLYDSVVHPVPKTFARQNLLKNWISSARDSLPDDGLVWASIIMDFGFLGNEAVFLVDQYGDALSQACLCHPTMQDILRTIIGELAELGVDGIVLDVTDAYPNSTGPDREGFLLHCFCDYCVKELKQRGFREPRSAFAREPSPARFVLRKGETGTAHIDPPHDWLEGRYSDELVNVAVARKFASGEPDELQAEASRLLLYMRARVHATADAVRRVLQAASVAEKRSAVVLGDYKADLSQLVTLPALAQAKSADEYWLPFAPDKEALPGDWRAVQFLGSRSTYYTNRFFEVVEKASETLVRHGVEAFLQELLKTSKGLMSNEFTAGGAYTAESLSQFEGFAGVPLNQEDHINIVDQLTSAATGDVLPPTVLERFRIATADRPTEAE